MAWNVTSHGMQMTLARNVPDFIQLAVKDFVNELSDGEIEKSSSQIYFAIHPGGPKIIDSIQAVLELSEEQVAHSKAILRTHGNISSATLPHIWARMLNDSSIPDNTLIVSLAFGPGLTVAGALLRKRCHP